MTINEQQDEIIEEFELFSDWMDKYENIIDMGKELPLIDAQYKVPENLIKGCQSSVWLQPEYKDGKIWFTADSDAIITKGLISMMIRVLSGHTPQEIIDADLYFINTIGLQNHLSPNRSNGLLSMLKQMKMYALAFKTQD
ncbi:cysteine desulfuration protein SufE [Pedobacter cryoconitis]|uniref:Cysteine desulfuration protein SufE n=1 Tax=Pedobacter cryoconitis TaxID=188932 RepID=A0A7W9E0E5_9SPHI|nr:SufE family protein [Pedobacter cryoconitis]MBB5637928.1 cysteine desulfuration protein SufE [Pedobacter cryoconitis]MBB6270314.1 cysteine desulfuration protein SufE [Pedobacter cryoconitis]